MHFRKVDQNIVMNSARVVPRSPDAIKLEDEIVNVIKSPPQKSNRKRKSSPQQGPVINLQQQIIIQQAPKSPPKLKKKKKSKKKKTEPERKPSNVQQLLKQNLKKYRKQKKEEEFKKEVQKLRVESFKEIKKQLDVQIRQQNQQRFSRQKSPQPGALPWGIDQNKLKQYWSRMLEIHDKLERNNHPQDSTAEGPIKEKLRRHKLGLDFLNQKPEQDIQKMIQKQKSKQVLDTLTSPARIKNNFSKQEESEVKAYMMYKKEFWKQKQQEEKQIKKIQKEKLRHSLQQLQEDAKRYAKSRNASVKSNIMFQSLPPPQPANQEPPNFQKLEQEYKEIMRSMRQSSYSSTKSHSRRASQMKFVEWLQQLPEAYIQEQITQMQQINEQMNNQGFMYKLKEQELYQFLEQFLKEKFEQQSKATLKERFMDIQHRYHEANQNIQSQGVKPIQQKPEIKRLDPIPPAISSHSQEEEESLKPEEEELEQIYHVAATMIQKVWRGYKTRQLVYEYLQYLLVQQEEEDRYQFGSNASTENVPIQSSQQTENEVPLQSPNTSQQSQQVEEVNSWQPNSTENKYNPERQKYKQVISSSSSEKKSNLNFQPEKFVPEKFTLDLKRFSDDSQDKEKEKQENYKVPSKRLDSPKIPPLDIATPIQTPKKVTVDPEYFLQVFKLREETLNQKFQSQLDLLDKMLENKKVSSQSFHEHREKLEKRYQREKDKITSSKNELQRIQELFNETIKSTQKDQQFMERIKNQFDDENLSFRQIFSIRSETEYSEDQPEKKQQQYGLMLSISKQNDQFKKYSKKKCRSFEQQVSIEVSMKNEEIQTSGLYFDQQQIQQTVASSIQKSSDLIKIEDKSEIQEQEEIDHKQFIENRQPIVPFDDRRVESITEFLVQQIIVEFAEELNNFPLQSLGVLMEWDEEADEIQLPQGFPTTLNFIKDYLIAFSEYLQQNHLQVFLEQINTPLGISPQDLLKTISLSDINPAMDDSQQGPLYPLIKHIHQMEPLIDEEIWNRFNDTYAPKLKYYNEKDNDMMKDLEQFHLRMVYEAFNEAINYVRPYGIRGQPYPWKFNPLKVYCNRTTVENIERAMGFAIAKMLKWGAFLCGFIPEKIETPQGELIVIEDDYLNQIKEDRLQQMLEYEIQDNEEKWVTYDEEQAEVAVELADIVFEMMLDEASEELFGFM
ncbi:hypothetical protein pb186bvf_014779 [Paramecium bursaria]